MERNMGSDGQLPLPRGLRTYYLGDTSHRHVYNNIIYRNEFFITTFYLIFINDSIFRHANCVRISKNPFLFQHMGCLFCCYLCSCCVTIFTARQLLKMVIVVGLARSSANRHSTQWPQSAQSLHGVESGSLLTSTSGQKIWYI